MSNCFVCNEPTNEHNSEWIHVMTKPVTVFDQFGQWDWVDIHYDCMNNEDKPETMRVCDVCNKTGKDLDGKYPSPLIQGKIVHAMCVDWDDVRKYRYVD